MDLDDFADIIYLLYFTSKKPFFSELILLSSLEFGF